MWNTKFNDTRRDRIPQKIAKKIRNKFSPGSDNFIKQLNQYFKIGVFHSQKFKWRYVTFAI